MIEPDAEDNSEISWPPPYTLTRNKRARHIKLKISAIRGLEIVVPYRFVQIDVDNVLNDKKKWIEANLKKLPRKSHDLPKQLELLSLRQTWKIHYKSSDGKLQLIERPGHELVVMGKITQKHACKILLQEWLRQHSKPYLTVWLEEISRETKLKYSRITIRGQLTRWGSCSPNKSINLNYKLLFIPLHLVKHILLHELCHTVHLNHSARFWDLVKHFDPLLEKHKRDSVKAQSYIPTWIE